MNNDALITPPEINTENTSLVLSQEEMKTLYESVDFSKETNDALAKLYEELKNPKPELLNFSDLLYTPHIDYEVMKPVSVDDIAEISKRLDKTIEQNEELKKQNAKLNSSVLSLKERGSKQIFIGVVIGLIIEAMIYLGYLYIPKLILLFK